MGLSGVVGWENDAPQDGAAQSQRRARCDRIREVVTLEALFEVNGWSYTPGRRIRCLWPDHDDHTPDMQLYPETNSVYCYACSRAGDVIELTRHCVPSGGTSWGVDAALTWLEETFDLPSLTPAETLKSKLQSLVAPRSGVNHIDPRRPAEEAVRQAFFEVERGVPHHVQEMVSAQREYIWAEGETKQGDDLLVWSAWARGCAYGSYARRLQELILAEQQQPEAWWAGIDDREKSSTDSADLWDIHIGSGHPTNPDCTRPCMLTP